MKSAKLCSGTPEFYSWKETAWALGITESDVSRLVRIGLLPVARRRSRLVIRASDIARLVPSADDRRVLR